MTENPGIVQLSTRKQPQNNKIKKEGRQKWWQVCDSCPNHSSHPPVYLLSFMWNILAMNNTCGDVWRQFASDKLYSGVETKYCVTSPYGQQGIKCSESPQRVIYCSTLSKLAEADSQTWAKSSWGPNTTLAIPHNACDIWGYFWVSRGQI